jgi:hypothetical protein
VVPNRGRSPSPRLLATNDNSGSSRIPCLFRPAGNASRKLRTTEKSCSACQRVRNTGAEDNYPGCGFSAARMSTRSRMQLTHPSHVRSMEGRWPQSPNARGVYRVGRTKNEQRWWWSVVPTMQCRDERCGDNRAAGKRARVGRVSAPKNKKRSSSSRGRSMATLPNCGREPD